MSVASELGKLTDSERKITAQVDKRLRDAGTLRDWWRRANTTQPPAYAKSYTLIENYHDRGGATGFRDTVEVDGRSRPFVGADQEIFFDRVRPLGSNAQERRSHLLWARDQLRLFAYRYYLRVMKLARPQRHPDLRESQKNIPGLLATLSLWPKRDVDLTGTGALQLFYKERDGGRVGKFAEADQFAVSDLDALTDRYQWMVLQLQHFKYGFDIQPLGKTTAQARVVTPQTPYVATSKDWLIDRTYEWDAPGDGDVLGEYGTGYAFIARPEGGLAVYGPDTFQPAFTVLYFRFHKSGRISVRSSFVVPEIDKAVSVPLGEVLDRGMDIADMFSMGYASRMLAPGKKVLDRLPGAKRGFDPLLSSMQLANVMSMGFTGSRLGYSKEVLSRIVTHSYCVEIVRQIDNARRTWGRVADWTDPAGIPDWVKNGRITLAPDQSLTTDSSGVS